MYFEAKINLFLYQTLWVAFHCLTSALYVKFTRNKFPSSCYVGSPRAFGVTSLAPNYLLGCTKPTALTDEANAVISPQRAKTN
jgi:hypothetical protein